MSNKSLTLLLVAGGCGLVASYAITKTIAGSAPSQAQKTVPVVVAASDLETGITLAPEMIKLVDFPQENLTEGMVSGIFSDLSEVTGQRLRIPVFAGEPILKAKLGDIRDYLRDKVRPGYRALMVTVSDTKYHTPGLINPGDYVDVIWTYSDPKTKNFEILTLIQNVKVLAVGNEITPSLNDASGRGAGNASNQYTLELSSQQSEMIAVASEKGRIRLTLRPDGDDSGPTSKMDKEQILSFFNTEAQRPVLQVDDDGPVYIGAGGRR